MCVFFLISSFQCDVCVESMNGFVCVDNWQLILNNLEIPSNSMNVETVFKIPVFSKEFVKNSIENWILQNGSIGR